VSLPISAPGQAITVNGAKQASEAAEDGTRAIVVLKDPGHFELLSH